MACLPAVWDLSLWEIPLKQPPPFNKLFLLSPWNLTRGKYTLEKLWAIWTECGVYEVELAFTWLDLNTIIGCCHLLPCKKVSALPIVHPGGNPLSYSPAWGVFLLSSLHCIPDTLVPGKPRSLSNGFSLQTGTVASQPPLSSQDLTVSTCVLYIVGNTFPSSSHLP